MHTERTGRGFSLVEVIIAVGVFAVAITAILGVMPALVRRGGESAESLAAQGLAGPVEIELRRMAAADFAGLAGSVPVMSVPLQGGFTFVAARDGLRMQADQTGVLSDSAPLAQDERYFLIELWQFNEAPLRYDGGNLLAVYARVSWPYFTPGSTTPTPADERNQLTFVVPITR